MSYDLEHYLCRLTDHRWLSRLAPDEPRSVMDSSLNQRHGIRDCNFFLRDEEDEDGRCWSVLVDYEGPGCLTRFWTAGDFDGELEIFLDGASAPWLRTTLREFFSGDREPFIKPLVMDCPDSSMGRVSYLPIPFSRGCKVRAISDTGSFYWQINALRYDESVDVSTPRLPLDESLNHLLRQVAAGWSHNGGYAPLAGDEAKEGTAEIAARDGCDLWTHEGPATVLELVFQAAEDVDLRRLALQIFWDGAADPAVATPLAHLVCQGGRKRDFDSLLARRRGQEISVAWPMPFHHAARMRLVNPSTHPVRVSWRLRLSHGTQPDDLQFHCCFQSQLLAYGIIYDLLRAQGRGRFVGLAQLSRQIGSARAGCFQQEGNEYAFVDGERDPSWLGTGTEDYFNCAYFYQLGEVDTPTHGCLDQTYSSDGLTPAGLVSAYRWHLLDSIPFQEELLFVQEAGCPRKGARAGVNGIEKLHYEWICCWYQEGEGSGEPTQHPHATSDPVTI